jgi:acetyl-CoA carboxylase biotin carboxylase subunit
MKKALKDYIILGVRTPIDFLIDIMESTPFLKGDVYTNFIETHFSDWSENFEESDIAAIAYVLDEMCNQQKTNPGISTGNNGVTPFSTLGNWRL